MTKDSIKKVLRQHLQGAKENGAGNGFFRYAENEELFYISLTGKEIDWLLKKLAKKGAP